MIYWSSSNTLQFVMLSKIDGLNNNSIENTLGEIPSVGNSLEATLANKSSSELLNLGMEFMLNALKIYALNSIPLFGSFSDVVISNV
jgi:hypothetical protein